MAVWGLAFKADTDDMREAPSIEVIDALLAAGIKIRVYDPQAMENAKRILGDKVTWTKSVDECTRGADAIAVVTDWSVFITQDWPHVASLMRGNYVFDGRNCLGSTKVLAAGLIYRAIGRPELMPGSGKPGSMGVVSAG